jgi:hypothetical protein
MTLILLCQSATQKNRLSRIIMTTRYDGELQKIAHYKLYPNMIPWIGEDYSLSKKKILFIGESHYLPKEIIAHHDIDKWYLGKIKSSIKDDKGINTRSVIERFISSNKTKPSHRIFLNVGEVLKGEEHTPKSIYHTFAFMNFFQRPAELTGGSIRVKQKDIEVANNTLLLVIEIIKPDIIIIGSQKAYKHLDKKSFNKLSISLIQTPHPASVWWNRRSKKYANLSGKERLIKALKEYS